MDSFNILEKAAQIRLSEAEKAYEDKAFAWEAASDEKMEELLEVYNETDCRARLRSPAEQRAKSLLLAGRSTAR